MNVIKKLVTLYNNSIPITKLQCDTIDYKIFKYNDLIRFCNINDLIRYTPVGLDKRIDAFCGFVHDNPYFWMIPLTTAYTTEIYGFVLKSYHQKAYRNVFCNENICSFYGFHNFENYKQGYPIILVEGTKDCNVIQQLYPYTLATLTCGLGQDDIKALTKLTNKILLCYDMDNPGRKAVERDTTELLRLGCKILAPFYRGKDPGENFDNPVGLEILKNSIKSCLSVL